MNKAAQTDSNGKAKRPMWAKIVLFPLWLIAWPFMAGAKTLYIHFIAYLLGRTIRDDRRIYSIKFIWYGDSVYLHPMIWGSLILHLLAFYEFAPAGWLLLIWFVGLLVCYITVMYDFNITRAAMLLVGVIAFFGVAYFSTMQWSWNPLSIIGHHLRDVQATVSPGFYVVSAYAFAVLIASQVMWAWLFHRVELDESYVYEHQFLQGTTREPIFARGLKRETSDLLELLLLGAGDIQHRTRNGYKRFVNVPFASLWVGTAIDSLLDYRRKGEVDITSRQEDVGDDVRIEDAHPDEHDGEADHSDDGGHGTEADFGDDDAGDPH